MLLFFIITIHVVMVASASTFSGSVVRTPNGGEGLPKVCCRIPLRLGISAASV